MAVGAVRNLKTNYMKTAKEIKEELEKEHGWNFSSEENIEMYYDLFLDVQKVALRQPAVIKSVCPVCKCIAGSTCAHSWHYDNKNNWNTGQSVL